MQSSAVNADLRFPHAICHYPPHPLASSREPTRLLRRERSVENPHNCRLQKGIFVRPLQLSTLVGATDHARAPKKTSLRSLGHEVDRILGTPHAASEHEPWSRDDLALLRVHCPHRLADGSHCNAAGQQPGHDESREPVPEASQRTRLPA